MSHAMPESIDGLPNFCGSEDQIAAAIRQPMAFLPDSDVDFDRARSGFAIGLHMHQPLVPAGPGDAATAEVISNLQVMLEHPELPDAHNAPAFLRCYARMGLLIPQLVADGASPRIMLDYSGCLLHGLRHMGAGHVIETLRPLIVEPAYRRCVEWLGTAWGHAVAPSTPPKDFRRHVIAWQHHFAAIFGLDALSRVKGFSPPEMAIPNHPDDSYEFVHTLKECGYRWVLLQEHSIESTGGGPLRSPHLPHLLVARHSSGQSVEITAIIKTQGSDTKLVGQMQPYSEAQRLDRSPLGTRIVPPLVTQIADGENGGVMMNEFPAKYLQVTYDSSGSETPAMNVTEYLEHLEEAGVRDHDLATVQPINQSRIWERFEVGSGRPMSAVIRELQAEDPRFHVEGSSWTADVSWVHGYEGMLRDMASASSLFSKQQEPFGRRQRESLFHLLVSQTSCFRYWGQGVWTQYGRELCRRAAAAAAQTSDA